MREIHISQIINTVRDLCIESNYYLSNDVKVKRIKLNTNDYLRKESDTNE